VSETSEHKGMQKKMSDGFNAGQANGGVRMNRRRAMKRIAMMAAAPAAAPVFGAAAPPDRGLIAWWNFDQVSLESGIPDASGNGHTLTVRGLKTVPGAVGNALRFPGGSGWEAWTPLAADFCLGDQVTTACWVRVARDMSGAEGVGLVNAGTSYLLRITSGMHPSFHIYTDGWGPVLCPQAIRPNEWYHVVGTYDGKRMAIYVNGQPAAARRRTGAIHQTSGKLILGRQVNALDGDLDEVRVYNRALTAAEVRRLYDYDRARLRAGVVPGGLAEPFENLFGRTRDSGAERDRVSIALLPPADLVFAVFTDTHIGVEGEESVYCHNWRVEAMIRQINALGAAFVVNCGDIITTFPDREVYAEQCRNAVRMHARFRMPVHFAPGNHDVGNQVPMRVFKPGDDERKMIKPKFIRVYREFFGRDYYAFRHGPYHFTVIDASLLNSGLPDEAAQWTFLERELRRAQDARMRFAFMHNPPFWRRPDEPAEGNYEPVYPPARKRLLDLLVAHGVQVLFCGHTHFPFVNRYGPLEIVTLNSPTFNRNFPEDGTHLPGQAEIYDPYKVGWLAVLVRRDSWQGVWVNTYERERDLPRSIARRITGPRILAGTPTKKGPAPLNTVMPLPRTFFRRQKDRFGRVRTFSAAYDIEWRVPEVVGSRWSLVRLQGEGKDIDRLAETLENRPLRGTTPVWPLPPDPDAARGILGVLGRFEAARRLFVENGRAGNPQAPLTSWMPFEDTTPWRQVCHEVRAAFPQAKVVVGRWPLPRMARHVARLAAAAAAARKAGACAISVWAAFQDAPEERVAPALEAARKLCAEHGLGLWLEVAAFQKIREPLRTARFGRLLALAAMADVPVFWWIGADDAGGLLDRHLDPTPLLRTATLWNELLREAEGPPGGSRRQGVFTCAWTCNGKRRQAWWRVDEDLAVAPPAIARPGWADWVVDSLVGRTLEPSGRVEVLPWPRVAVET